MRVLISGAGIGGLTLAYWLHQHGHTPVVVEKAPHIRSDGYMIDFTGSGWDVANRMGLIPQLQQKSFHIPHIAYVDTHGQTTARMSIEKLYRAAKLNGKYLALNRSDIAEVLYHAVESDVDVRFDTTLQSICQSADSVTTSFSSGAEETFDLVVGADGIHSNVRRLTFGAENEFAHYLGYYVAAFYTSDVPSTLNAGVTMYVEPHLQFGVYPVEPGRWITYIVYKSDDEGHITPEKRLDTLRRHLANAGWIVPDILQKLPPQTPIFHDTLTQIQMPRWSSNRVVLIGDAAYCLTLISGQGASMAMAGAYFLANELQRTADYHQTFARYERRLRPHIERSQVKARRFAPSFIPANHLRVMLTHWAVRLIDLPPVSNLVGKQISIASIIEAAT